MEQLPEGSPEVFPLFSAAEIDRAISRIAGQLNAALKNKNPLAIVLLQGGLVFSGKLLPQLKFPLQQDYLHASRYGDATAGKTLQWISKPQTPLANRTVLLLDDIYDRGHTLEAVYQYCLQQGAKEVYSAVLVKKQLEGEAMDSIARYQPDFAGLECGDEFVIGSGMDYRGFGRNIPGIYAVRLAGKSE